MNRIFGVETEFGCLVDPSLGIGYEAVVEAVKDHVFYSQKLGAIDLHPRDEAFEPAQCGGFLINGARLYVDAVGSHEEYATPECATLHDLVASDLAGRRILQRVLHELDLEGEVSFYSNGVDHFGGGTFGCHENYLVRAEDRFLSDSLSALFPFLVTRQIFAGSGRVGGHLLNFVGLRPSVRDVQRNPVDYIWVSNVYGVEPDDSVPFQLSQRADHILKPVASRVRFNRALVNPKWESFYSYGATTRLHLLFPEPNQMEFAYALRIGTTCIVLDLIEEGLMPEWVRVADPVELLKSISRDQTYKWMLECEDGRTMSAIDLHRELIGMSEPFRGRDLETDWVLTNWEETLNQLERDPMQLANKLDWVAKKKMLEMFIEREGLDWTDDMLHSLDLEYHNLNPERSLYEALRESGEAERFVDEIAITNAMTEPPENTRAYARAHLIKHLIATNQHTYWVDWDSVYLDRQTVVELQDPFDSYKDTVSHLTES